VDATCSFLRWSSTGSRRHLRTPSSTATNAVASWWGEKVLVLLRHGEAAGNADGLLLGRIDSPLTDRGKRQAAGLAAFFGPGSLVPSVSRVITSPLIRARGTAESLGLGIPVEVDDRWIEVDYGEFDGQKLSGVPAEVWRAWRADPGFRPKGGETLAEMGVRVTAACEELFGSDGKAARGDSAVVVVSHVSPIKAAVGWALGTGDAVAWRLWLATASMTVIGWGHGAPVLHRYNVTLPDEGSART
jgi:broad specificity phosphatase PhoE